MTEQERKHYLIQLARLDSKERRKLWKEAAMLRDRAAQRMAKRARIDQDGDEEVMPRRGAARSVEDFALRILWLEDSQRRRELEDGEAKGVGQVVWLGLDRCTVELDGERIVSMIPPQGPEAWGTRPTVGDRVEVRQRSDGPIVSRIEPRQTMLARPDPSGGLQVVVANVEVVALVVSVVAPPLHTRIIDRYWVAIRQGGAEMLLVVNKVDLLRGSKKGAEEMASLEPYRRSGLRILELSATQPSGALESLREALRGQTCAFVGHSGVGKSSLLNALCPELGLLTGSVSQGYGRGTHTTTASSLHDLGEGTRLIDTPGIRSFGLGPLTREELLYAFPEFEQWAVNCKFRDCNHIHEPACGVRAALDRGDVSAERYETYRNLFEAHWTADRR